MFSANELEKYLNKFYWYTIEWRTVTIKILVYATDSKHAFGVKLFVTVVNLCPEFLKLIPKEQPFWISTTSLEECDNQNELTNLLQKQITSYKERESLNV